jgi:hypothetical protein
LYLAAVELTVILDGVRDMTFKHLRG